MRHPPQVARTCVNGRPELHIVALHVRIGAEDIVA
jgi:hypothetical protein